MLDHAVGDHRCFHLAVDLLLSPIRGRDKSIKTCQFEEKTGQANTARADFDADQVEAHNQPMHEGESRTALKELGHMGTDVEAVMPPPPGLKSRSGNLELCGGLALGEALGSQLPVLLKEVRTLESIPAWLAVRVALLRVLDEGSHSDLLCSSLAFE